MSNSIVSRGTKCKPRPDCKIKDCDKPADISLLKEYFCASHGTLQLQRKEKSNGK
jgi:hypothetical protein